MSTLLGAGPAWQISGTIHAVATVWEAAEILYRFTNHVVPVVSDATSYRIALSMCGMHCHYNSISLVWLHLDCLYRMSICQILWFVDLYLGLVFRTAVSVNANGLAVPAHRTTHMLYAVYYFSEQINEWTFVIKLIIYYFKLNWMRHYWLYKYVRLRITRTDGNVRWPHRVLLPGESRCAVGQTDGRHTVTLRFLWDAASVINQQVVREFL